MALSIEELPRVEEAGERVDVDDDIPDVLALQNVQRDVDDRRRVLREVTDFV